MSEKDKHKKTEDSSKKCDHEWRWMTQEDRTKRWFQTEVVSTTDPEQPDLKVRMVPANAVCDKCGTAVWAHGRMPWGI